MNFLLTVVTTGFVVAIHEISASPVNPNDGEVPLYSHSDCQVKSGVDNRHILHPGDAVQSEDPKFKEYLLCFLQKSGYVSESGEFHREAIRKQLKYLYDHEHQEAVEEFLKECVAAKEQPLEAALGFYKCYRRHYPQEGFFYRNSLNNQIKEDLAETHAKCRKESPLEDALIERFKGGDFDHPKGKKHIHCVYKIGGYIDEFGEFNRDKLRERLYQYYPESSVVEQYLKNCLIKKDSPEETAYYLNSCLYENTPHKFNIFSVL